uniref:ATP synthase subunit a n=1 Tax=Valleriola javanica TaxID=236433 RepID=A0A8T9ZVV0_9HEMI|nr:ATPase subunit 6 [Valleriola javanica]
MMTNLFSTFDPASSTSLSLNWISTTIALTVMPTMFWIMPSRYTMLNQIISKKMHMEFKTLMPNKKGMTLMLVTMFMFIMINNMMGLLPYVFTGTSHVTMNLTLALPMWIALMMFGWTNKTNEMFTHLVPQGTPSILMPFMVCIETISNLIRPGALTVRLTANMVAGHLLMSLLGDSTKSVSKTILLLMISTQMMLMMFETAVSVIQAYVFSTLSTLYTSEI